MIALLGHLLLTLLGDPTGAPAPGEINFAHLVHLMERVVLGGDSVTVVHVYANYPDYRWASAAESGPEGIACVDDAARAAVLFMRAYELRGDTASLGRARGLLEFVEQMQAEDGEMYNFILADRSINRTGKTSFKSFGWWACRGLWAMATGERVFRRDDPAFSHRLGERVERMLPHVQSLLKRYDSTRVVSGLQIPRWLPYESGADVSSELLLGLIEHLRCSGEGSVAGMISRLSDGLVVMQDGDDRRPPYGLHRSWETLWHMWGNAQTCALSRAGVLLHKKSFVASAVREARGWYGRLLMDGFMKQLDVAGTAPPERFEQIAYAVRPMAVGLVNLYEATRDREYLVMAGLAASWLTGNNAAGRPMYDPSTGRCFDGIRDSLTLNLNSGAESTIEALMTLLEVERYPVAARYLTCRRVAASSGKGYSYVLFRSPGGAEVTLARERSTGRLSVLEGERSRAFIRRESMR